MTAAQFDIPATDYAIPCRLYLPDGPVRLAVLGVHGFGGDSTSTALSVLAKRLEPVGGAVLCFDFPCHGRSATPDHLLSVELCRRHLQTMVEELKRRFPSADHGVFATSFGGYITLQCLEALSGFRIVLRAPAVTMADSFLTILPDRDEFFRQGVALCGFERKMLLTTAFYDDLRAHTVSPPNRPVLIIHGTKDNIVPFAAVRAMAESTPEITLHAVEGADHRFRGRLEEVAEAAAQWYASPTGP